MDTLIALLDNPVLNTLSLTLMHFLWQGLIISAGLYLLLNSINNKHSTLRYNLTLCAMLLNILAPVFTFIYLYQQGLGLNASHTSSMQSAIAGYIQATTDTAVTPYSGLSSLLAIAWMIGVLYFSIFLLKEILTTYQLPRKEVQPAPDKLLRIFSQLINTLGIKQPVRLLLSLKVEVPMVVGWIKPVVLLPVNMATGLNNDQLTMLLAHELAHVRRYDYLVNFLQSLVELLLFFHPCVKWVSTQVRAEREYCCDDIAVQHCGCPMAYATTLTEAELMRPHHIPHLAMAASGGDLKKRVFRVVGQNTCAPTDSGQWLAAFSSILLVSSLLVMNKVTGMTHGTDSKTILEPAISPVILSKTPNETQVQASPQEIEQPLIPEQVTEEKSKTTSEVTTVVEQSLPQETKQTLPQEAKQTLPQEAKLAAALNTKQLPVPQAPAEENTAQQQELKVQADSNTQVTKSDTTTLAKTQVTKEQVHQAPEKQLASISSKAKNHETQVTVATQVSPEQQIAKVPVAKSAPVITATPIKSKIIQPKAIRAEAPYYPMKAKRKKLQADVSVSFLVSERGRVTDITFDEETHSIFQREIKKTLKNWRFTPATMDGQPTALKMQRVFSFQDPDASPITMVTGTKLVRR